MCGMDADAAAEAAADRDTIPVAFLPDVVLAAARVAAVQAADALPDGHPERSALLGQAAAFQAEMDARP
jgi:hypothetical protein